MKWRQTLPTAVTLLAMLVGFFSILLVIEGLQTGGEDGDRYYRWAAQLIMLAMLLDGIDGNLARMLKGSSDFGAELDTFIKQMSDLFIETAHRLKAKQK